MKTNDLVILMFSSSQDGLDDEVGKGGRALFTKHVRKHILGSDDVALRDHSVALSKLVERRNVTSPEGCLAQRAWLLEAKHWQSGIESVADLEVIASTDPLPNAEHPFDPNLGIYIVAHFDHSVLTAFGLTGQNVGKKLPADAHVDSIVKANQEQSKGLIGIFKKLGIAKMRKLCFLACRVAVEPSFKSLLVEFVERLHDEGYDPMIAGWDIPVEVEIGDNENYGRKKRQDGDKALTKTLRVTNKFVYVYRNHDLEFSKNPKPDAISDKIKAHQSEVQMEGRQKKTQPQQVWMSPPHKQLDPVKGPVKGDKFKVQIEYVKRVKYTTSQWSG